MYFTLSILFVSLGLACSRNFNTYRSVRSLPRTLPRTLPTISNSLVNLGKIDIAIHFNAKPDSGAKSDSRQTAGSLFNLRSEPTIIQSNMDTENCACSSFRDFKNPFTSNNNIPLDLIGKILKSSNLFSYNQEPVQSSTCCEPHADVQSHANVQETIFFDFGPSSHVEPVSLSPINSFPLILDNILPKLQASPKTDLKPKAIEIFFFPKNKEKKVDLEKLSVPTYKTNKRAEIQVVGDRELKNEFKSLKYRPVLRDFSNKELNMLERQNEKKEIKEKKQEAKQEAKVNTEEEDKNEYKLVEQKDIIIEIEPENTTPAPFTASTDKPVKFNK